MKYNDIWKAFNDPLTKEERKVIKQEFYLWAKDKTKEFLLEWYTKESILHIEIKGKEFAEFCAKHNGSDFNKSFQFYVKHEKFVWDYESIPEQIEHINNIGYQEYLNEVNHEYLEIYLGTTNDYCSGAVMTLEEKIYITPLLKHFDHLSRRIEQYSQAELSTSKRILLTYIDEEIENINSYEFSPKMLRITDEAYIALSKKYASVDKKFRHHMERRLETLKMMHECITKKGFPKLDMYRRLNRLPGAGWSNQK